MKLIYIGDFERLKELGFKSSTNYYYLYKDDGINIVEVIIYYDSRNINIINWYSDNGHEIELPPIVYDLIQAGLVKKEENETNK